MAKSMVKFSQTCLQNNYISANKFVHNLFNTAGAQVFASANASHVSAVRKLVNKSLHCILHWQGDEKQDSKQGLFTSILNLSKMAMKWPNNAFILPPLFEKNPSKIVLCTFSEKQHKYSDILIFSNLKVDYCGVLGLHWDNS